MSHSCVIHWAFFFSWPPVHPSPLPATIMFSLPFRCHSVWQHFKWSGPVSWRLTTVKWQQFSQSVIPPSAFDKPSIMKRYHHRRTCGHTSPHCSPQTWRSTHFWKKDPTSFLKIRTVGQRHNPILLADLSPSHLSPSFSENPAVGSYSWICRLTCSVRFNLFAACMCAWNVSNAVSETDWGMIAM